MTRELPVSVVIPAYDAETTLAAAVASVRAQSAVPYEIIVVDDGSRDGTRALANSLGVTLVVQANAGSGAARNAGIRRATQPWIALLDADDRWLPGKLTAEWEAVTRTGDGLCATDYAFVHPGGSRSPGGVRSNRGYRGLRSTRAGSGILHLGRGAVARALPSGMFLLPSTVIFRRAIVIDRSEWFLERSEVGAAAHFYLPEDCEWYLRMLRWTDVTLVERSLVEYAVVAQSLSSNAGRMRYGDVKLGELVLASPARYAAGAAEEWRRLRPAHMRAATLQFMRQLEFDRATIVAGEAFNERPRPLEALLLAFARAMRGGAALRAARTARTLWRRAR